jgi:hypothetical protein
MEEKGREVDKKGIDVAKGRESEEEKKGGESREGDDA